MERLIALHPNVGQRNGKGVIISDNEPPQTHEYKHILGMSSSPIWSTPRDVKIEQTLKNSEPVTQETTIFPAYGETRLLTLTIPPGAWAARAGFNPEAAGAEIAEQMPDMLESFNVYGNPFNRSDSIDYTVVLDGEVILLLEVSRLLFSSMMSSFKRNHRWLEKFRRMASRPCDRADRGRTQKLIATAVRPSST